MRALLTPLILMGLTLLAGLMFLAHRAGAAKLRRLRHLVKGEAKPVPVAMSEGRALFPGRYLPTTLVRNLRQLGIELSLEQALLAAAGVLLPSLVAGVLLDPLFAPALGFAMILAGYGLLNVMAARRVAQLGAMMPGFFDRVRQLLAIGNSLPTAFARAVGSAQPVLAAFFAPTIRRIGNGASFPDSIQQCADDIDVYEMRLFAATVAVNMRFGGSLVHSLNNLVAYLRKRASIERELRSTTAQIRASAWVLGLLPLLVAGTIVTQNREYARWFVTHPTGKWMLVYCLISQIAGALVMRMIVRMKF